MEKANLSDKIKLRNELKQLIYSNTILDGMKKYTLERTMNDKINHAITIEELKMIRNNTLNEIGTKKNEEVKSVADTLKNNKPVEGTNINNVNTMKKDNGTVITSFKTNEGSTYVKDSSYSGNIDEIVDTIAHQNPEMKKTELTTKAFYEMQGRQIDIPVTSINNSNLSEETKKTYQNDNLKVNTEYQVLVDEKNRLYDLKKDIDQQSGNNTQTNQATNTNVIEKAKVKVKSIPGIKFDDSAFVDALLLGNITFYTGVLGLCAILSKM